MLYPPMADLLKHVNNRYLLVNVIAKRSRQIAMEADTMGIVLDAKPVSLAINEIAQGKLKSDI
ncbi:MAG: DNA-directed RNA polymerase subunit omega [Oscillospiraceae bacterium]|jgi:DNA-directed RNA polymerase subunit omega